MVKCGRFVLALLVAILFHAASVFRVTFLLILNPLISLIGDGTYDDRLTEGYTYIQDVIRLDNEDIKQKFLSIKGTK